MPKSELYVCEEELLRLRGKIEALLDENKWLRSLIERAIGPDTQEISIAPPKDLTNEELDDLIRKREVEKDMEAIEKAT